MSNHITDTFTSRKYKLTKMMELLKDLPYVESMNWSKEDVEVAYNLVEESLQANLVALRKNLEVVSKEDSNGNGLVDIVLNRQCAFYKQKIKEITDVLEYEKCEQ